MRKPLHKINLDSARTINTINPHSYCVAKTDVNFYEALQNSDVLLPDGIGIVWAERVLNSNRIQKVAGFDVFRFLMNKLNQDRGSCFFLGSNLKTLSLIKEKAAVDFPNVKVQGYSPPYKEQFSLEDNRKIIDSINKYKPDVLFVGMTAPKQEKWAHTYEQHLIVKNICCIGAVFDFYAGNVKRSSDFWISLGLEWLPRLVREPKRLFRRNFISTPKFILEVLWFKIFGKGIL